MSIRKTYESEDKFIVFGVDRVTGVFLQVFHEIGNIKLTNWSEFEPVNRRLTYDAIQEAIRKGDILESEFNEICKISLGDFNVYFSGILLTTDVPNDFEMPKALMKKVYSGKGFRIRTIGDYYKVLKLLRWPVSFSKVTWYPYCRHSTGAIYEFTNDIIAQETISQICI